MIVDHMLSRLGSLAPIGYDRLCRFDTVDLRAMTGGWAYSRAARPQPQTPLEGLKLCTTSIVVKRLGAKAGSNNAEFGAVWSLDDVVMSICAFEAYKSITQSPIIRSRIRDLTGPCIFRRCVRHLDKPIGNCHVRGHYQNSEW